VSRDKQSEHVRLHDLVVRDQSAAHRRPSARIRERATRGLSKPVYEELLEDRTHRTEHVRLRPDDDRTVAQGDGVFTDWAEKNPASAPRRFFVRFDGTHETPAISNYDHEERTVKIVSAIAYAHGARTCANLALAAIFGSHEFADLLIKDVWQLLQPVAE
jgi:hypothetical protein